MSESSGGRERTDESLRAERGKTDSELERKHASVEHSADAAVQRARLAADRVLKTARDVADGESDRPDSSVVEERSQADGVIADQRSTADDDIRREREGRKRALANLLRLEREETDQHLLTERGFSDEALNTRDIFLAMVSHDLRTLLGGIAMTAELLQRDGQAAGDRKAAILSRAETIQRLTARMNRLIGDLVDVASIEAGKLLVTPVLGDLFALIRESVEVFQPAAEAHGIELTAHTDGPPLEASFDRAHPPGARQSAQQRAQILCARGPHLHPRGERQRRGARLRRGYRTGNSRRESGGDLRKVLAGRPPRPPGTRPRPLHLAVHRRSP